MAPTQNLIYSAVARLSSLRDEDVRPALWAALYFFCLLAGYYILRPLRDEMGIEGGVENLPWLWTGTLLVILAINPIFGLLVSRLPRSQFIRLTYRFFSLNALLFLILLEWTSASTAIWIGRAFYIWTSVFNLFVVSVFWAFLVDLFHSERAKRLFGFAAAGGTMGGVLGSSLTAFLAERIGPLYLLPLVVVLLELAVFSMRRLARSEEADTETRSPSPLSGKRLQTEPAGEDVIGGSPLSGFRNIARSRYLLGICLFMVLFTVTATFLYFEQAELVQEAYSDRAARTALFARIDLAVNSLTVLTQLFLTGRVVRLLGVGLTLALLPLVSGAGFLWLSLQPSLAVLILFQVLRRSSNYALARPAREILYTVVAREDKYKTKALIDTFVYRTGDQIGAWSYALMGWIGLSIAAVSLVAIPLALLWLAVAIWLGLVHSRRASQPASSRGSGMSGTA